MGPRDVPRGLVTFHEASCHAAEWYSNISLFFHGFFMVFHGFVMVFHCFFMVLSKNWISKNWKSTDIHCWTSLNESQWKSINEFIDGHPSMNSLMDHQ